jgi:hypothetical protein
MNRTLFTALLAAIFVFRMPVKTALAAAADGAAYGLFPIGWIVVMAIFLYALTVCGSSDGATDAAWTVHAREDSSTVTLRMERRCIILFGGRSFSSSEERRAHEQGTDDEECNEAT